MQSFHSDCWYWAGGTNDGYGYMWDGEKLKRAHRAVYEALVGAVPEGLVLDHLCKNKLCINPEHLEPVTQAENMRRFDYSTRFSPQAARTHCKNGHLFTGRIRPDRKHRLCVTCKSDQDKAYKLRKKSKNTDAVIS